ncbi:FMN-binding negative transcriptional regulator [Maribacter cobaltidurans]|uniref:Protease n=1 Tax=Maribacter cobaltidurans TaxID=1178778 RepID=A0A223V8P1_9FLAO|nr:FMN-binding negative transcriptional regulator [Maribacter cobaltidurans]ASV31775.1 protease [Maribacter cobaltidurans]GGD93129.1 protease synthase and sporulation protein PAI 2 [Maribacter cobaltidurans]
MYTPNHYKNEDISQVRDFIENNGFGILINQVDGKHWATHIPMELVTDTHGTDFLVSHISKANPQWKSFNDSDEVLCIFNGPHSYVSSSWYTDEEVPTWNYIAVHVYGLITILTEEEVLASMHKLVDKYESDSKHPISLHDMSDKTMAQIRGVVGFKIRITDIQATYKLSQGREKDHAKIISELKERDAGAKAIATKMEEK